MSAGARLPGTPQPMHFWTGVGGVRIAGDSWGDANGPLVLLQAGHAGAADELRTRSSNSFPHEPH